MTSAGIGEAFRAVVDKFTKFFTVISGDHRYIHEGKGFTLSGVSSSISAAGTYVLSLTTPAEEVAYVHLRPAAVSSTANTLQMRIAEASTVTGGSAAVPFNRNRNSTKASATSCAVGVTLSAEGTVLEYTTVGSGSNPSNSLGGGASAEHEIVLKPSTTYSIRFENVGSTTATVAGYSIFWYEESSGI